MKLLFIIAIFASEIFAFVNTLNSFKADFVQTITDEKNKTLTYSGSIFASKPQNAVWKYITPINKNIYINRYNVIIVEPEIEQVIIRKISSDFDFFNMIKNAKKIDKNKFIAKFEHTSFIIVTKNQLIESISYIDQFENSVKILFMNQVQNSTIDEDIFIPVFPLEFDIIRD
ncbi:MAG: LolA-like outer membrane lipoprotein chaperone [Campylobacterota bacterium]|nr:LolA-like outer membrane lipoprotein chaperone [Campylobacterota bacterium]